ncbi:helix-turn-helix domain-containing protein [Aquitalea magnusonii]|nr:helix-turn-helix domain-containing protein [Aquitalea magnusonii]
MNILVPTFSLYGEQPTSISREYLHIEEISTRSAARNWQIDTHTHEGMLQLLFVFSGSARVQLDSDEREYESAIAVIIPPGVIHAFKFASQTRGYVLTLDASGLAAESEDGTQMFSILKGKADVMVLAAEGNCSAARIQALLEQIAAEFNNPGPASIRLQVWQVRALLLLLVRVQLQSEMNSDEKTVGLTVRFRELVETHYAQHWPVERYAAELNLTESRLNRLSQKNFGKSAFGFIQERLLLEARRKLIYTSTSISQLAYELGFSDPAYFCRFFKKQVGMAPGTFRISSLR